MRRRLLLLLPLLICLVGWPVPVTAAPAETGFLNATAKVGDATMPYVVYVPRDYTPDRKWPVILFLHGAGERGSNGLPQSQVGIGTAIRMNPERFPAIVVMPQCPVGKTWGQPVGNLGVADPGTGDLALAALDATVKLYNGDTERLYLTGLSMGGFGTWGIAARYPSKFAALMPVCGGGKPEEMAPVLKNLPVWVFHGDQDMAVPVARGREMVEAIKAAGGTKIKYTEYPGVGHNSWDKAYGDREAIAWLLEQRQISP